MKEITILVVADEEGNREKLAKAIKKAEYKVIEIENGDKALNFLNEKEVDLLLADLGGSAGMDGVELVREARKIQPDMAIILIMARGMIKKSVEALKEGAYESLIKPVNIRQLRLFVDKAIEKRNLLIENRLLRQQLIEKYKFEKLVGKTSKMKAVFDIIERIAPSKATVLIQGETGTGKELVAQAIHQRSLRANKPFIKVSCASLPEGILESELFGHEKGSFTSAISSRQGRFELADGGTLFLDEVSEMSPQTQTKLLRVLQERKFEKVGGTKTINVDVRLIAATNKDLKQCVANGTFREDLFYRLNVVTINLPPVRERREDIPLLVEHFIEKYSKENHKFIRDISSKAMRLLMRYDWPGNVRELENCIENAVVMTKKSVLSSENLLPAIINSIPEKENCIIIKPGTSLADAEKELIIRTLEFADGNKTKACELLGISRRTIHKKLKEYGY